MPDGYHLSVPDADDRRPTEPPRVQAEVAAARAARLAGVDLGADPTLEFGPRPPGVPSADGRGRSRSWSWPLAPVSAVRRRWGTRAVAAGLALCGGLAVGSGAVALWPVGDGRQPATDRVVGVPVVGGRADCPPLPAPGARGGRRADVLGTGCPQVLHWEAPVLLVTGTGIPARRYALGRAGDEIAVGRFHCADRPVIARYRPATGELVVYPPLPAGLDPGGSLEPRAEPPRAPGGHLRVRSDGGGCDRVDVTGGG